MARHNVEREKFLVILATTPFINHACKKIGISRATIYRWMKDNYRFKRKVLKALEGGRENLIEIAEASMAKRIHAGDMGAIKFFLAHNSNRYRTKAVVFEEPAEEDKWAAWRGPDGEIRVSKQTADIIRKRDEEQRRRKNRAMGFPDPDPKDPTD